MKEPDNPTPEEGKKALGAAIIFFREHKGLTTAHGSSPGQDHPSHPARPGEG